MDYHSTRDDPNVDPDMVKVLLAHGANPNQPVRLHNDESVWALFLISIYEGNKQFEPGSPSSKSLKMAWYRVCESMIGAGAHWAEFVTDCDGLDMTRVFYEVFGAVRAETLRKQIEAVAIQKEEDKTKQLVCRDVSYH
jgi:hypothetical protein